jgi:hypothetical protein
MITNSVYVVYYKHIDSNRAWVSEMYSSMDAAQSGAMQIAMDDNRQADLTGASHTLTVKIVTYTLGAVDTIQAGVMPVEARY